MIPATKFFLWHGSARTSAHGSILDQILSPIQSFPQRLKSVRIISFAFLLDGSISKAANRGTQTFDCIVPETEGFPQSVFQRFSLCIECLLSRRRNRNTTSAGAARVSMEKAQRWGTAFQHDPRPAWLLEKLSREL
jgi:hypothetical protein